MYLAWNMILDCNSFLFIYLPNFAYNFIFFMFIIDLIFKELKKLPFCVSCTLVDVYFMLQGMKTLQI